MGTRLPHALVVGLALAATAAARSAQAQSTADFTPLTITPGAPAGAYPLSGFESVNYFNGSLNFSLPLVHVSGRGEASTTVALTIDQHWSMTNATSQGGVPTFNDWTPRPVGYGPGVLTGRAVTQGTAGCGPNGTGISITKSQTRFTFTGPDGSEIEFRDVVGDGAPVLSGCVLGSQGANRGTVFVSNDGSSATFTSATPVRDLVSTHAAVTLTPTGTLMWPNGTRYLIVDGRVTEIRDRNGNLIQFTYANERLTQIKDSLRRTVNFAYQQGAGANEDWIMFRGFGGADRKIIVVRVPLGQAFRADSGYQVRRLRDLFPEFQPQLNTLHEPTVVKSVILPNGRFYTFDYNEYGELEQITLPTTGRIRYTYAAGFLDGPASGAYFFDPAAIYRRVVQRDVYRDANSSSLDLQTVIHRQESIGSGGSQLPYVLVEFKAAGGSALRTERHYYHGFPSDSTRPERELYGYPGWREGRERKTEFMDGEAVIRTVENFWSQGGDVKWWPPEFPELEPQKNPQLTRTRVLLETGEESNQFFEYDEYNNRTVAIETGFPVNGVPQLVRKIETDFVQDYEPVGAALTNYATDPTIHIRSLPLHERIYRWNGTTWDVPVAQTDYSYDNYTDDGVHDELFDYGATLTGLDAAFDGQYPYRGNRTTTERKLDDPPGSVFTHSRYAITGNVVASIDPRGFETTFEYAEHFGGPTGSVEDDANPSELRDEKNNITYKTHAFPTVITNRMGHVARKQVDYYLGRSVDEQDSNLVVYSASYGDPLDRPLELIRANSPGGNLPERNRMRFVYNDNLRFVRTRQDRNSFGDDFQRGEVHFDTLGRDVETRTYEVDAAQESNSEYVAVRKSYDGLGRIIQVSNPFRIKPINPETPVWTTNFYDKLDRIFDVVTPDSQVAQTRYLGSKTTSTDQAGKERSAFTDGLGRTVKVVDAPNNAAFNYETLYEYNAFDQVTKVTSGGGQAPRTFFYDNLGRLRTETSPEGGTVINSYDASGNLVEREDGRVTTTYEPYDRLDRPTSKSYTPELSPSVSYTYDDSAAGFAKGRLTKVSNGVSTTDYRGYDRLGRVTQSRQTTDGTTYPFFYAYDLVGNLTSKTYPSGRVVTTNYDRPGRVTSVQQVGAGAQPFASLAQYASSGLQVTLKLGNQLWENTPVVNSRLQPEQMGLGASNGSLDLFNLDYAYNDPGQFNNNGNVRSAKVTAPSFQFEQRYTYDDVNRLKSGRELGAPSDVWSQTYDYDPRGNRALVAVVGVPVSPLTPLSLGAFDLNNQIIASDYDDAGNQTRDAAAREYTYDGENHQATLRFPASPSVPQVLYSYDGEGRRVRKAQGTGQRVLVYDAFGVLAAEYLTLASTGTGVQYSTADHLGSVRVVTDAGGNVLSRHDYLPFGEEIPGTLGVRSPNFGYDKADGFRQRFTGKERDGETGFDFFEARYLSSQQGRFTSPDPIAGSGRIADPQGWNRYAYARNNPLRFVDPNGLDYYDQKLNRLGTDGTSQNYVVTDKDQVNLIKANNKSKAQTPLAAVGSAIPLPGAEVIREMGAAVDRSNAPSAAAGDKKGGFHEEGGQFGRDAGDKQVAVAAAPGAFSDPSVSNKASVAVNVPANKTDEGRIRTVEGDYHVHPSGTIEKPIESKPSSGVTYSTRGPAMKISSFIQPPSEDTDVPNNRSGTFGFVLGAGSGSVYIYNQQGTLAVIPLDKFRKLGN